MLNFLGFQVNMHNDDIVYWRRNSLNSTVQYKHTQKIMQIFLDSELLAHCFW